MSAVSLFPLDLRILGSRCRTIVGGSLQEMASLIQADKAVCELHETLEKRLELKQHSQITSSSSVQAVNPYGIPKLTFAPKKPSDMPHSNMSPAASGRRSYHTPRNTEANSESAIEKSRLDEIKLLKSTVERLTTERDTLFAEKKQLLLASSGIASSQLEESKSSKIRILPESQSQSLGLYSCEMFDPMKRVPRSVRLRALARHRIQSPTKTIVSKQDRASIANVADYTSEPAQRVAYTTGRLMAQYMLNAEANVGGGFSSLSTRCRTKLALARQVEQCSQSAEDRNGRQALKSFVNPFTLATACDCMNHLIEATPIYRDVMNEVFAEIMVGLYAPDTIHYQNASDFPELRKPASADATLRHLKNIPYCELNKFIGADLFLAQTELKDSWALAKRVLLVEDSLNLIIKKQLQTHRAILLRFHFNAWIDALHCRKIWRETFLRKAIRHYRILHQSKAFNAWQACLDLAGMDKKIAELAASLADEQRVLSGEMWNLNDQIKQSDEELTALRLKMAEYITLRDNALMWRKRSAEITGHVATISNEYNEAQLRVPFPIANIFELFPDDQKQSSLQTPMLASTIVRVVGQSEATQQVSSGTSVPGTTTNSRPGTQSGSRPGTSNRPGSAGQSQTLEMTMARLLTSPAEEIIARMVLAGTGVAITGWSDKQFLSGMLHSKMLDFMQLQEYETAHKDPEAAAEVWSSVLVRARLLGAVFHESITTVDSLMAKSAVTRCILMADIILNCGCPPISEMWTAFRRRFVVQGDGISMIADVHQHIQHLVSSQESAQELDKREDINTSTLLETFLKECPIICEESLGAYRDAMEFACSMRVLQEYLRRWFSSASLKLVNRQEIKIVDVNLATSEFPKAANKSGSKKR